jgi:enolase-phosphatase E1
LIDLGPVRSVLLDVEGTTTPIRFVHDVLFPFSRERMPAFLAAHAGEAAVADDVAALRAAHALDAAAGRNPPAWDGGGEYARWLIDQDRKATPLKSLQGRIWEEGYRSGVLRGQVYPDVRPAFERWTGAGKTVAIFSSGSVLAQRLLFAHSEAGDLERFLSAHFDTTTGPKAEAESYRRIASALGRSPSQVLFLSDVTAELHAARAVGMKTGLVAREMPATDAEHPVLADFASL